MTARYRPPEARTALVVGERLGRCDAWTSSMRQADIVRLLAEDGWNVTFASATGAGDEDASRELREAGIPVWDARTSEFERLVRARPPQLAVFTSWPVAELYMGAIARAAPRPALLVDVDRIQFAAESRRIMARLFGREDDPPRGLGAEFGTEAAAELDVYGAADLVCVGAERDVPLVNGLLGCTRGVWLPDAAEEDLDAEDVAPGSPRGRRGILLGIAADAPGGAEAIDWLVRTVMPAVRRQRPEPLVVLGDRHAVEYSSADSNVITIARARRLSPVLGKTRLAVLPLPGEVEPRLPSQAMLAGTPLVATEATARSLGLRDREDALIADEPAELARAINELLEDDALWLRLSRCGRERRRAVHARGLVRARLREAIDGVQPGPVLPVQRGAGRSALFELRLARREAIVRAPALRRSVEEWIPAGARVLVVTEGSDELLRLGPRTSIRFPPDDRPLPLGGGEAVRLLAQERRSGAQYLVVPTPSRLLASCPQLDEHLRRFRQLQNGYCRVILLAQEEDEQRLARLVAFYLPQFHPIPDNDLAWGRGFTEWTNVARAQPLFDGHQQPHLPGELGFYDLRVPEIRDAQARLAAEAGIEAFCYYHYWFGGKRLLERPFNEVLATGRPDFPFCLCWANEPWSRRWDGEQDQVIQAQSYSPEDDLEHIRWLLPALRDRRALCVDGKSVFLIYRPGDLPDPARTVDLWREEVRAAGLPGLYLIAVETAVGARFDATGAGFDAELRFQPRFTTLLSLPQLEVDGPPGLRVWDYTEIWPDLAADGDPPYRRYETVCARWDNSARVGNRGWVLHNATPDAYQQWLSHEIEHVQSLPPEHRLVFLNAWNEWGEGAHLEPDRLAGREYLEATRGAVTGTFPAQRGARVMSYTPPTAGAQGDSYEQADHEE